MWATGISPDSYPTQYLRDDLDALGVIPADKLLDVPDGTRILVAGAVTHRQRPATAQGVTFMNLEDETGMVNVLCAPGVWARYRKLAQTAPALVVRGIVQNASGSGHRDRRPDGPGPAESRLPVARLPLRSVS